LRLRSIALAALAGCLFAPLAAAAAPPVADDSVTQFYERAVHVMDGLPQPPYVTYRLAGTGDGFQIGLTVRDRAVWLLIAPGSDPSSWSLRHRTYDYQSEIIDDTDHKRYLSARSFFDPTWYGAYRALREGMLNAQDPAPPRASPDDPSPAPVALKTIGGIAVMGPALYSISDRGDAACPDGTPGRALHLKSRSRDPLRQLTDVIVDAQSLRFCMMRYGIAGAFGFHGIVEQHYADVGGYWMQTDGLLDGTLRAFGISTHHGIWRYRLLDMTFPTELPHGAFAPSPFDGLSTQ
jgi:hypothetical protein